MSDSPTIAETLLEYLAEGEFEVNEEGYGLYSIAVDAEAGAWTAYAVIREAQGQLLLYSVIPVAVPDAVQMALFITRANFGLALGNFELDLDDGELRYKTSIDVEGAAINLALIDHLVIANFSVVSRYLPGIEAVAAGLDATAAIDAIEGPYHDHDHDGHDHDGHDHDHEHDHAGHDHDGHDHGEHGH